MKWGELYKIFMLGLGLLVEGCISPNAELPFSQLNPTGFNGSASNLSRIVISGPNTVAQNSCQAYAVQSQLPDGALLYVTEPVVLSFGASSSGSFYQEGSCQTAVGTVTLPANANSVVVYFKSTAITNLVLQAWANGFQQGSLSVTVKGVAAYLGYVTEPSVSAFSGSVLSTQPVLRIFDSAGVVNTLSTAITLNVYSDPNCIDIANTVAITGGSVQSIHGTASFSGVTLTSATAQTVYLGSLSAVPMQACSSAINLALPPTMMAIAAGSESACAVSTAGNVYCWGGNSFGELGNNSTVNSSLPVEVLSPTGTAFLSGIISISGNYGEFCAVSGAGNVYCWGDNSDGQLGNGSTTNSALPVEVVQPGGIAGFLNNILSVSVGTDFACSVALAGNAYCWGMGSNGQLGNNISSSSFPVEVLGVAAVGPLSDVTAVSAGSGEACAIADSNVYCWGDGAFGRLGVNNQSISTFTPVQVVGVGASGFLSGIGSISANGYNVCSTASNGSATYCWGDNGNGEFGNNSTTDSSTPVVVSGVGGSGNLINMSQVSVGPSFHACALSLTGSGTIYCWGLNTSGEINRDPALVNQSLVPLEVLQSDGTSALTNMIAVSAGTEFTCALSASGHVYCWGSNSTGQLGQGGLSLDSFTIHQVFNELGTAFL